MKNIHVEIITQGPLTAQETRVLAFVCAGYMRKEIARLVHRSYGCVSKQIESIAHKLDAHSASEIVAKAVASQLIKITLQILVLMVALDQFDTDRRSPPRTPRAPYARITRIYD